MEYTLLFKLLPLLLLRCLQTIASDAAPAARNTRNLAHKALTVSATRAREAPFYVSRLSSGNCRTSPQANAPSAFEDCMVMMAHSADRLQRSVVEIDRMGRNVQTWVSSALTDQDMCLDSLSRAGVNGRSGKSAQAVRMKVESVRKYNCGALSLVNRMI